ncbi:hypothetical protein [Oceanithermus desulfurans]
MAERAWRVYLVGYGLQVAGWTLALVAAPFLALRAGASWVAVGAALGVGPRLLAPALERGLRRAPVARLAAAEGAAALVFWTAALAGSHAPGWAALAVYLTAGALNVLEGIVAPLLVAARSERSWTRANALLAALGMGLPLFVWPAAGALAQRWGLPAALAAAGSCFALRAWSLVFAVPPQAGSRAANPVRAAGLGPLRDLWPLGLALAAAMGLLGYLQAAVPVMLQARGSGPAALGIYGAAFSGGMLAAAALVWAAGGGRERPSLAAALFSLFAGSLILTRPGGWGLYVGAAWLGAGLAGLQAVGTTLLQRRLAKESLGAAVAAVTGIGAAAMLLGAGLAGLLAGAWTPLAPGLAAAWALVGLVGAVSGLRDGSCRPRP